MSGPGRSAGAADPRLLLLLPAAVYLASYAYLAFYHGRAWLWSTPVHESGRYTLLETTFYASHFLGHVPVLLTLALLAGGSWRSMSPPSLPPVGRGRLLALAGLGLLVAGSLALAIGHFGLADTLAFILQRRQRPDDVVDGGSWNLHLPSTLLQLALIPVTVFLARSAFARPVVWSRRGLALLLAGEAPAPRSRRAVRGSDLAIGALAVLFAVAFAYQVVVSLGHDIGALAQQPSFAEGGRLGIPYLLASHFFEHVLESLFFALVTLLLVWGWRIERSDADRAILGNGNGDGNGNEPGSWRGSGRAAIALRTPFH